MAGTPLACLALRSSQGRLLCPIRGFGRAHRLPAATSPAFAIGVLAGSWRGLGGVLARTLYFPACSGSAYSCEKPERSVLMAVSLSRHPEESQQNRAFSRRA